MGCYIRDDSKSAGTISLIAHTVVKINLVLGIVRCVNLSVKFLIKKVERIALKGSTHVQGKSSAVAH